MGNAEVGSPEMGFKENEDAEVTASIGFSFRATRALWNAEFGMANAEAGAGFRSNQSVLWRIGSPEVGESERRGAFHCASGDKQARSISMPDSSVLPRAGNGSATRQKRLGVALSITAILLIYVASPYVSLWRFAHALRAGDPDAFASRVDFPRVRESIKAQLIARFFPPELTKKDRVRSLIANLAPSLLDQVLDAYLTPDGLAALLSKPEIAATRESALAGPPQGDFERLNARANIRWSKVRYAFFTTPLDFVVDLNGTKLTFRFYGLGWRLRGVDLPPAPPKSNSG